ncbi:hypothetical protein GGF32_002126 [Allomyces javanicus]|nr:hypothetical protein GGF32_002126 [Allomyces javanicus]
MPRVLAVQSHVVHGHVGNKAATFPLQLLGVDVDPLHTVEVANHSGYPLIKGTRLEGDHFTNIFDALRVNKHDLEYDLILSGYLGNPTGVPAIAAGIKDIKERATRNVLYVLDPVLGDNGKLYLPAEMITRYQETLFPLADVLTPNGFEAELLANAAQPMASAHDALAVARTLAAKAPAARLILLTTVDTPDLANNDTLALVAYVRATDSAQAVTFPRMHAQFTGTGDLLTALIAASLAARGVRRGENDALVLPTDEPVDLPNMVAKCIWVMQQVLAQTHIHAEKAIVATDDRAAVLRKRELRLIHCKREIEHLLDVSDDELDTAKIVIAPITETE